MSVRLPKDLEQSVPRKGRSAWVIEAVRQRLRQEQLEKITRDAAAHYEDDLAVLSEWGGTSAPLSRARKGVKNK